MLRIVIQRPDADDVNDTMLQIQQLIDSLLFYFQNSLPCNLTIQMFSHFESEVY